MSHALKDQNGEKKRMQKSDQNKMCKITRNGIGQYGHLLDFLDLYHLSRVQTLKYSDTIATVRNMDLVQIMYAYNDSKVC